MATYNIKNLPENFLIYKSPREGKIWVLIFVIFGVGLYFSILYHGILGILVCLASFYSMITFNGSIFNPTRKTFAKIQCIGSFAWGKEEPIPKIIYVSVFKATMVSTTHSIAYRKIEFKQKVIQVNLIYDKNKKITVYQTVDEQEGLRLGKEISEKMNVPIFNAINKNREWM